MNYREFITSLESGLVRVAEPTNEGWQLQKNVKEQILDIFRQTQTVRMRGGFRDKEPLSPRDFEAVDRVRMVPGGSAVRAGAYIGKDVVIMPPSYINIGAYVDDGSMIDSHVLVGSCAQIGKNVHLSAGVQIGGVLEPIANNPVIIEDDCFVGAGCVIVEGVLVRRRAVIAPGVALSASIPIYDMVNEVIYKGEVPCNAVVVSGSRDVGDRSWAKQQGLQLSCAMIIKYRDPGTDSALELERVLRGFDD